MFGSEALEIGIGLIFVYLLLSLACTAGTEIIAALLKIRAGVLRNGVYNLLSGSFPGFWKQFKSFFPKKKSNNSGDTTLAGEFYNQPLIKGLHTNRVGPSYIPSSTFAVTLIDQLIEKGKEKLKKEKLEEEDAPSLMDQLLKGVKDTPLENVVRVMIREIEIDKTVDGAEIKLKEVQDKLEVWYDSAMDRVSGWFKRWTKAITFVIALFIVFLSNADTFEIARALSQNPSLRESLVTQATAYAEQSATNVSPDSSDAVAEALAAQKRLKSTMDQLYGLGIPLGWQKGECDAWFGFWPCNDTTAAKAFREKESAIRVPDEPRPVMKLAGLLVTTLALTLGAPFWFDMLGKIIAIRSSGSTTKKESNDTASKKKKKEDEGA